jgi:hypothetical protein
MTKFKGNIQILSFDECLSQIKRYNSILQRNRIINQWIKSYNLNGKNYYLIFQPDEIFENKPNKITGIISFSYQDKVDVDMKVYTSIANRDAIIEEWRKKYSENIILKIKPYE